MKLTPRCYYTDDPDEDNRCSRCGRLIQYVHIVLDGDNGEIEMGAECVKALMKSGEIDGRLPRRGRYDWKLSDVRANAYWSWYGSSIAHAF